MKRPVRRLLRALTHTRIVKSGSPPLYRLMLVGVVMSAIVQAYDGSSTDSVAVLTPDWFDWLFIGLTALGGLLGLIGLYMIDENRYHASRLAASLNVERVGLAWTMTVIVINIVAVVAYYDRPPTSMGSWFQIIFWAWGWTRLWEIRKALRELTK